MRSGREVSLYVAGSSSAVPRPGRASSGYAIRAGGGAIALDFGTGAFSNMRRLFDVGSLDAIIISHMHADHFLDLIPLRYALRYEMKRPQRLPVYLPPAGISLLTRLVHPLKETGDFFGEALDLREYDPGSSLRINDFSISFASARHYIPAYAMRIEAPGALLGFSADTAPCDSVPGLVRGVDLFLCEASLGAYGVEAGEPRGHLNALEAGTMAARAGVGQLVLTHYGSGAHPPELAAAAKTAFDGPVSVADDGDIHSLGQQT